MRIIHAYQLNCSRMHHVTFPHLPAVTTILQASLPIWVQILEINLCTHQASLSWLRYVLLLKPLMCLCDIGLKRISPTRLSYTPEKHLSILASSFVKHVKFMPEVHIISNCNLIKWIFCPWEMFSNTASSW